MFESKVVAPYRDTYRGELGQAQVELLELLYMHGPLRQHELAGELRPTKQHVSKMTARLAQLGLIARSADNADGRSDAGRAYVDRHSAEGSSRARELFSHLSEEERKELDRAMLTVTRLLEKA